VASGFNPPFEGVTVKPPAMPEVLDFYSTGAEYHIVNVENVQPGFFLSRRPDTEDVQGRR